MLNLSIRMNKHIFQGNILIKVLVGVTKMCREFKEYKIQLSLYMKRKFCPF
jgi:hypothetical protein